MRLALGSVGPDDRARRAEAEAFAAAARRLGRVGTSPTLTSREFGRLAAGGGPPDRRPPLDGRLPAPRRRGPRPPAVAAGVPEGRDRPMSEHYHAARQRRRRTTVRDAWIGESLLYVLRERLGLLGAQGRVRAGRVRLLQRAARRRAGVRLPGAGGQRGRPADRHDRGLAPPGAPTDVQQAFVDAGAVQCGFCTPGLIMAAHALLDRTPEPTDTEIREELSGNICRCTGYGRIIEAVQQVAAVDGSAAGDCMRDGMASRVDASTEAPARPTSSAAGSGDTPPRARTASPRCRARSPSPSTCRSTGCCGVRRCARRTRTPASCDRRRPRRGGSTGSRRSSPPTTCPASRRTG